MVLQSNDVVSAIWQQTVSEPPPNIFVVFLSFGIPLVLALPGVYRAIRRFERDGDQFMLIWLLSILASVYLPTVAQTHFFVGVMIPLMYFATRAIEDFWLRQIPRRWWLRIGIGLLPIIFASNIAVMLSPVILVNENNEDNAILLQPDYIETFRWLAPLTTREDVVLAGAQTSLWLPGWTGARVYYGHPDYTLEAREKASRSTSWYEQTDTANCQTFFDDGIAVDYVIYGPREARIGPAACRGLLQPLIQIGTVRVYRYNLRQRAGN